MTHAISGTIDSSTLLVLASAVHFQNKWEEPFTETKSEKFCLNPKTHIDIEMMHQTQYYKYYKDEQNKFAAVQIPYQVSAIYFGNVYWQYNTSVLSKRDGNDVTLAYIVIAFEKTLSGINLIRKLNLVLI